MSSPLTHHDLISGNHPTIKEGNLITVVTPEGATYTKDQFGRITASRKGAFMDLYQGFLVTYHFEDLNNPYLIIDPIDHCRSFLYLNSNGGDLLYAKERFPGQFNNSAALSSLSEPEYLLFSNGETNISDKTVLRQVFQWLANAHEGNHLFDAFVMGPGGGLIPANSPSPLPPLRNPGGLKELRGIINLFS